MSWVFLQMKDGSFLSPSQQASLSFRQPPPPPLTQMSNLHSNGFNLDQKVSPSILLIIVILAIIFFVSGLLHLLVRFLLRPQNRDPDDFDNVTALQGQLQQLFNLHDAGVDQSFIDTLPVFNYKSIIGVKDPFDCAVCLCEFEADDNLRLLPKCSHAFHMECIDTWLLSHSTCPLCRASLISDFSPNASRSPIVLVLESGSGESSREILDPDRENCQMGINNSIEDDSIQPIPVGTGEKVVAVKLGKFKNVDGASAAGEDEQEGSSVVNSSTVDSRRCFSMGSFAYILDETSSLRVPIRTPIKKLSSKKPSLPLGGGGGGQRLAMSECDCESRRDFNGFESSIGKNSREGERERDSFSFSKIWQRTTKEFDRSAGRAFSFRNSVAGDDDFKRKSVGGGSSVLGCDEENQNRSSFASQPSQPSFARRTLLWLVGEQNKVVHSSSSPNV
ncbi:RING-H2 finger protein ATL13-like [Impatiens glandulifera]|uniref:RING-H2 finger protein ATL13-like n=1 Tax=Impatiens glandulifera TaxID=253017 RepID=UPI001FB08DDE|nr:RING-H2 finger protein ATL13-like [Impatiens glandulifera]